MGRPGLARPTCGEGQAQASPCLARPGRESLLLALPHQPGPALPPLTSWVSPAQQSSRAWGGRCVGDPGLGRGHPGTAQLSSSLQVMKTKPSWGSWAAQGRLRGRQTQPHRGALPWQPDPGTRARGLPGPETGPHHLYSPPRPWGDPADLCEKLLERTSMPTRQSRLAERGPALLGPSSPPKPRPAPPSLKATCLFLVSTLGHLLV